MILDSDAVAVYQVETRDVNKAIKNNPAKFPAGYVLKVSKRELEDLRWNFSTAKLSKSGALLNAFTENGLYMLATILKAPQATEATLQIVETFAKIRGFSRVAKLLAEEKSKSEQKKLIAKSGELIGSVLNQEFAGDVSSETTIELNLAMLKIKHTFKREREK